MNFNSAELNRYARHFPLPNFGIAGQAKLKAASVLCIGAGGLGSPALLYLAAAGIGHIGIIDPDEVEDSNLQRQIIHDSEEIGFPKVQSAKDRLSALNPNIEITTYESFFNIENARTLVSAYDIILDGCDNFPTRYLSNDACFFEKKPNIYGSIYQFEGQCSVFAPHLNGACYRCVFPDPPEASAVPSCATGGVLGVLPGIMGSLQALEAIKLITGIGEPLINRFLNFDALSSTIRTFKIKPNPDCKLCGSHPSIKELETVELACTVETPTEINVQALAKLMTQNSLNIIDVRESYELEICALENFIHIPLGQITDSTNQLTTGETYYVLCHHGSRSAMACDILGQQGFKAINIAGGIHAWSLEIDPSMRQY